MPGKPRHKRVVAFHLPDLLAPGPIGCSARTMSLCAIERVAAISDRAEDEVRLRLLLRLDRPGSQLLQLTGRKASRYSSGAMAPLTAPQALRLLEREGALLVAARGPLPTLTEAIAGERIRGSWWGHPKGKLIFAVLSALQESPRVAACKLVAGKVTLIHRRLWPALIALAGEKGNKKLDRLRQEHQASGEHRNLVEPWPRWVPAKERGEAKGLSPEEARATLGPLARFLE